MRVKHIIQGRKLDENEREVKDFDYSSDKFPKCAWCGRPYRDAVAPIDALIGFLCRADTCNKFTRRTEHVSTRKIERVWSGKEFKWQYVNEVVDELQEVLGACKAVKVQNSPSGPLEALALREEVREIKELAQPDLI